MAYVFFNHILKVILYFQLNFSTKNFQLYLSWFFSFEFFFIFVFALTANDRKNCFLENIYCKIFKFSILTTNNAIDRDISWSWQPTIFTNHYFFLSEIIFHEKVVSLSSNDRFDSDKIFLLKYLTFGISL